MSRRPEVAVISARGRASFTAGQRRRLEAVARARWIRAPRRLAPGAFLRAIGTADIAGLTPRATPVLERSLLARLPALRAIALPTTGCDWIDLRLLESRAIRVVPLPGFSTVAAAEFTIGLLIALARKIVSAAERGRAAGDGAGLMGVELAGRTLGVVGLGAIGSRVARLARALGMRVVGCDPRRAAPGVPRMSLAKLLATSDAVTLHVPLDASTQGLLGARQLARLRPGTLLVNTARPGLVDTAALARALRDGRLAACAVDLGYLEGRERARLARIPGVLAVPHVSWYTKEAIERETEGWISNLVRLARKLPSSAARRTRR